MAGILDMTASSARAEFWADTLRVNPPARLLDEDGAPAPELMAFCERYGASLDFIFCGDLRSLILAAARCAN